MIDHLQNWMLNLGLTSWIGFFLYWLPMSICVCGYTALTWVNYQSDIAERDRVSKNQEAGGGEYYYYPTDTVGDLVIRVLFSVIPIVNIIAACLDVAPNLFATMFKWVKTRLTHPIVPRK